MPSHLGIYASQISGHLASASSYESIATVNVGSGGTTSITFSSIPSTYAHLQIRGYSPSGAYTNMRFNGDTTASNYRYHYTVATGSGSLSSGSAASTAYLPVTGGWGTSSPLAMITDILDYASTTKYKTIRDFEGIDANGSGELYMSSDLWMSTSAISSIVLSRSGATFGQYSSFALYGIKG